MGTSGKITNGSFEVLIEGKPAGRKGDFQSHGGMIREGAKDVLVGGETLLAARVGDRFFCTDQTNGTPHVGGLILAGAETVLINERQAARAEDPTVCLSSSAALGAMPGLADAVRSVSDPDCAALWAKYDKMASDLLAPAGDDARERNRIISGAYADLYLGDHTFRWAGLAAYASKQVGCAMDFATGLQASGVPGVQQAAKYSYDKLGDGNRALFMDVYPIHMFFKEQGYAKLAHCAAARHPPMSAQALDAFKAADLYKQTGDEQYLDKSLAALAWHEQLGTLQNQVYNDPKFDALLRSNETGIPLTTDPAGVVMGRGCKAGPGDRSFKFGDGGRTQLYNSEQRMNWILGDIGKYYSNDLADTPKQQSDLGGIRSDGRSAGGSY